MPKDPTVPQKKKNDMKALGLYTKTKKGTNTSAPGPQGSISLASTLQKSALSEGTLNDYKGAVNRGRKWIKNVDLESLSPYQTDMQDGPYQPIQDPDFRKAFDVAIKCSPFALAIYLNDLVMSQGLTNSTAGVVKAAFKWHFGQMYVEIPDRKHCPLTNVINPLRGDGETHFDGNWRLREGSMTDFIGNPVNSHVMNSLAKILRVETVKRGDVRNHSGAIKITDVQTMIQWSMVLWPLEKALSASTLEERALATRHVFYRAYLSTSFVLWTRCVGLSF